MQCIVSQPLPFLVLQNAYLVAKIQIYIGLEQTIILKNIIPQLLFSIILSHHFMYHSQWVANHSPNDYEKVASDSIVKVPLQTIHEPEVIWNDNSDKQDERLR